MTRATFRRFMAERRALRGDPRWRVEYDILTRSAAYVLHCLRKPTSQWEPKA